MPVQAEEPQKEAKPVDTKPKEEKPVEAKPQPKYKTYTVVKGDTLIGITNKTNKQYGLNNSYMKIFNLNKNRTDFIDDKTKKPTKFTDPNAIDKGWELWIPGTDGKKEVAKDYPLWPSKHALMTQDCTHDHPASIDDGWNKAITGYNPPIYAPYDGVVAYARNKDEGAKGKYLNFIFEFGAKKIAQIEHFKDIVVKSGQKVKKWDLLGYTGNTGDSSGTHKHTSVGNGNKPIDTKTDRRKDGDHPV